MNKENSTDVVVVGAGIVGIAHAYMAAKKGYKVVLFDRSQKAVGASVRNFGLIWPIGQRLEAHGRALRSRNHWLEIAEQANLSIRKNGSLHLAHQKEEMDVLEEFMQDAPTYGCSMISPENACKMNELVKRKNLLGALWSPTELTVNPRESLEKLPLWLEEKYGVILKYGEAVKEITYPKVALSTGEVWTADKVFVCGGSDFENLYPEIFNNSGMVKCKLQMMRATSPVGEKAFGPSLCAGLTLGHYASFSKCFSLPKLREKFEAEYPDHVKHGIHVLLALNSHSELVIGDSHEYSLNPEPFNKEEINQLILDYLRSFITIDNFQITERWHGIYSKLPGKTEFMAEPETGVKIVTGLSGAGMTLSFGLAEENVNRI